MTATDTLIPPNSSGIDVSDCNGDIEWSAIQNNTNISFVIIRLSLGYGTVDTRAYEYAAAAKKAGKKISFYHFAYPDPKKGDDPDINVDALKEAHYFKMLLDDLSRKGLKYDFSPAIDLEDDPKYPFSRKLDAAEYSQWLLTFLSVFDNSDLPPIMIYGSPGYLDARLAANHPLGKQPLWVAHYDVPHPIVPLGWTAYELWQYTAAPIPGATGNFDMDKTQAGSPQNPVA